MPGTRRADRPRLDAARGGLAPPSMQQSITGTPVRVPAGTTPEGDGIALGQGAVRIDAYIDFMCPFCRQFEERSGAFLDRLLDSGAVTLVYHPLGFLDRLSMTRYSSRASAASGCASDFGAFKPYKDALFANQPPEGGPGLSHEELVELGRALACGISALRAARSRRRTSRGRTSSPRWRPSAASAARRASSW